MKLPRKTAVITGLTLTIIVTVAAGKHGPIPDDEYKNLKVLPKDISSKDLSKIMVDDFQDALGVSCGFCHAENKETHKPDYASDEKPEKEIARQMMQMTLDINKKYFKLDHPVLGQDSTLVITCTTCHRGKPFPGEGDQ